MGEEWRTKTHQKLFRQLEGCGSIPTDYKITKYSKLCQLGRLQLINYQNGDTHSNITNITPGLAEIYLQQMIKLNKYMYL